MTMPQQPTPPHPQSPSHPSSRRLWLQRLGFGGAAAAAAGLGLWFNLREDADNSAHPTGKILHLQSLDGTHLALPTTGREKKLLINFWAPWCPPCVEELPMINAQLQAIGAKNFDFVAIAVDDLANVQRFWQAKGFSMDCAVAGYAGMGLMQGLGNPSGKLPFTVLLDVNGAILKSHLGALNAADLTAMLTQAQAL